MLRGIAFTLGCWVVGAIVLRVAIVQPEYCPDVGYAELEASATEAADWIARAIQPDGSYIYEWDADADVLPEDYNEVRHAGVTMSLYQWAALGNDAYLDDADQALEWMLERLVRRDGWAGLENPFSAWMKLGGTSLMSIGLSFRFEATGDPQYNDLQLELGEFITNLQLEDGSFLNFWDERTDEPVDNITGAFSMGQAFWALVLLHEQFPEEGFDEPAGRVAHYLATQRDDDDDFPLPPWPDHWASLGFGEKAHWGLDEEYIEWAEAVAGRFSLVTRFESQRRDSLFSLATRGPMVRGGALGVWVEGISGLWRMSTVDERLAEYREPLKERAMCGSAMLIDRQVSAAEAEADYARPELAQGAWFYRGKTRMDDQQHALSGLILTMQMMEMEEGEPWSR